MNSDKTIYLIGRIREKANSFILKELGKIGFSDIAPSHGDILVTLFRHHECTMSDLANNINRDRSTVTALVNKLIKLGYISSKKDAHDNRSTLIFLTEKGKELEPSFEKISKELYDTQYKGVDDKERELFVKTLEKIYSNF